EVGFQRASVSTQLSFLPDDGRCTYATLGGRNRVGAELKTDGTGPSIRRTTLENWESLEKVRTTSRWKALLFAFSTIRDVPCIKIDEDRYNSALRSVVRAPRLEHHLN